MKRLAALFFILGLATDATAQSVTDIGGPGVMAVPPTTAPVLELPASDSARRTIRGCPLERSCGEAQAAMLEFELEAFPPPGASPWLDDPEVRGAAALAGEKSQLETASKPSQLRPDLAWLDQLVLPDLPITWTKRLIDYLMFYKEDPRGRNIMRGWLEAQGRYRDLIVNKLRSRSLPEDLLYVSMIESSYDPFEFSRVGASGLWQFMPAAGRNYGLRIDRWVDERNDPLRSTVAVLDYFADLRQRFGDWNLALAAYNSGYGAVLRSISRYNSNDFYQLASYENGLSWGATLYVPKALACAIVGRNRAAFGFNDVKAKAPEQWEEVAVRTSMPLTTIAKATGSTVAALKQLNPQLRRGRTPPGTGSYLVRIPVGAKTDFARKLADLRSDWDGYDAYVVAQGDRLEDIATTFGISERKLKSLNEIDHDSEVNGGTILVVPKVDAATRERNRAKALADLHSSGADQSVGEPLIVAVPDKDADVPGKRRVFYRVVTGDTLTKIARTLGVTVATLSSWNGQSSSAALHPKMILQAWVDESFSASKASVVLLDETLILVVTRGSAEHLDLAEGRTGRARVEYTAKKKESFETIGKKFGLGPRDLARINRRASTTVLEPGEKIVVYQSVDRGKSERAASQWTKTPKSLRSTTPGHAADWTAQDAGSLPPVRVASGKPAETDVEEQTEAGGEGELDDEDGRDDASDNAEVGPVSQPR